MRHPLLASEKSSRRGPRAHKNKIGTFPPQKETKIPPPPKRRNFMDMGFSCRKSAFFPGAHEIGAGIFRPRLRTKHFTDTRIFLILAERRPNCAQQSRLPVQCQHLLAVDATSYCHSWSLPLVCLPLVENLPDKKLRKIGQKQMVPLCKGLLKALETTAAIKQGNSSCTFGGHC